VVYLEVQVLDRNLGYDVDIELASDMVAAEVEGLVQLQMQTVAAAETLTHLIK
jgi:hypothetical protein